MMTNATAQTTGVGRLIPQLSNNFCNAQILLSGPEHALPTGRS
jgi:hypothetical protein